MIKKINGVGARVILCTPTVIGEKHDGTNPDDKKLDEYAGISRKVAKETGSQLVDLRKGFIAYLKEHNTKNATEGILTSDTVHMNPAGNRLIAKFVLEALQVPASALPAPSATPAAPKAKKAKKSADKKAVKKKR
jgi:lysophospholipase L1-like esterase